MPKSEQKNKKGPVYTNPNGAHEQNKLKEIIPQQDNNYNNGANDTNVSPKDNLSKNGQAALKYLKEGKAVIPLWPKAKNPILSLKTWRCTWQEYQNELPTEEDIRQWWTKWPQANIGIVTGEISGIIVLDIDGPEGEEYLRENGYDIPTTPYVKTGKGKHYYFRHPKDGKLYKNFSRGKLKVDCRGDGGYCVCPPSIHPDGGNYEWSDSIFETPLADAPEWFLEMITSKEEKPVESKKVDSDDSEETEFPPSRFEDVIKNCAFMKDCVENAETLSEPEWHSALSIAIFCEDGEQKAHDISAPYRGYSYEETQRKIEHLMNFGPKKCSTIREQHGEHFCEGCKWFEKDTSPIILGYPSKLQQAKRYIDDSIYIAEKYEDPEILTDFYVVDNLAVVLKKEPNQYYRYEEQFENKFKIRSNRLRSLIPSFKGEMMGEVIQLHSVKQDESTNDFAENALVKSISFAPVANHHLVMPNGWIMSEEGLTLLGEKKDILVTKNVPFFISARLKELDGQSEKLELAFYRDKKWQSVIVPRDEAMNNKKLERYAKSGFPVSSNNSRFVVKFIEEFEAENISALPLKKTTATIGWADGRLISAKGVLTKDGFINDPNYVFYNPYQSVIKFSIKPNEHFENIAKETIPYILRMNDAKVTYPILGWFFASGIAPQIREQMKSQFPILNIFGGRGAGKSTIIELMWRMVGVENDLLAITTNFVLLRAMSDTNCVPVVFDEYKPSELSEKQLKDLNQKLKIAYRGDAESRGKADRTVEEFPLTAPIVIIGEDYFADDATKERSVMLTFSRTYKEQNGEQMEKTLDHVIEQDLEGFAYGYNLYLMDYLEKGYLIEHIKEAKEYIKNVFKTFPPNTRIPDRNRDNSIILLVGMKIMQRMMEQVGSPIPLDDEIIISSILHSLDHMVEKNETALDRAMKYFASNLDQIANNMDYIRYEPQEGLLYVAKTKFLEFMESSRIKRTDLPTSRQIENDMKESIKDEKYGYIKKLDIQKTINKKNKRSIVIDVIKLDEKKIVDLSTWEDFEH